MIEPEERMEDSEARMLMTVPSRPPWPRLELTDAVIQKNAVGHYYIVGYLPGGIRVAGWLHERPLPHAKEGENGTST